MHSIIDIAGIKARRVKATILSGVLGAGKTTLLNHIIREHRDSKIAVLVNDFGDINIDSDLIVSRDDTKIDLTGGCICCSIQKDLFTAVINQLKQEEKPEHIIVECSEASDPSQVLNTVASPLLQFHLHVDGLFTVIDSSQFLYLDEEYQDLVRRQIEPANLLILNKTDLIDEELLNQVKDLIRDLSPKAVIIESAHCKVPLELILGFNELPILVDVEKTRETKVHEHQAGDQKEAILTFPLVHAQKHDEHNFVFESWSFVSEQPFGRRALTELMENLSLDIIRAKGFVFWDDPEDPLVLLNRVGQWVEFDSHFRQENVPLKSRLVFIGKPGWKRRFDIESHLIACRS